MEPINDIIEPTGSSATLPITGPEVMKPEVEESSETKCWGRPIAKSLINMKELTHEVIVNVK